MPIQIYSLKFRPGYMGILLDIISELIYIAAALQMSLLFGMNGRAIYLEADLTTCSKHSQVDS